MSYTIVRMLRTTSSERFMLQKDNRDGAAVDIHYLQDGRVAGTVCILDTTLIKEDDVPELLLFIDDALLPHVSMSEGNLIFTVVAGRLIGNFESTSLEK